MNSVHLIDNNSRLFNFYKEHSAHPIQVIKKEEINKLKEGSILLHLSDYNAYTEDQKIFNEVKNIKGTSFLRACLIFDEVFIGPYWRLGDPCLDCAFKRIQKNNPESDFVLFSDIETEVSSEVNHRLSHAQELIEQAIINREDWSNRMIHVAENQTIISNLLPDYQCEFCTPLQHHSLENAQILFENKKKAKKNIYRHQAGFELSGFQKYTDRNFGFFKHQFIEHISEHGPLVCVETAVDGVTESGWGRTYDLEHSKTGAYLEVLERYANSSNRRYSKLKNASYEELGEQAVHPNQFTLHNRSYRDRSYTFVKYSDQLKLDWIWGTSLTKNEEKLIPAQMVFYRDKLIEEKNSRFVYETSNGCALGTSPEEAIFYGILEVIERDSFMTSWYLKERLTKITPGSLPAKLQTIINKLNENNCELLIFDITKELGIPAIWAWYVDKSDQAEIKTFSAAGCHIDPVKAVEAAVFEVITSVPTFKRSLDYDNIRARIEEMQQDYSLVQDIDDHIMFHAHQNYEEKFDFLLESTEEKSLDELFKVDLTKEFDGETMQEDLGKLVNKIKDRYGEVYAIRVTDNVLRNFELECCKVLIPELLTMSFGHSHRRVNIARLKKYAEYADLPMEEITLSTINQFPHPFP